MQSYCRRNREEISSRRRSNVWRTLTDWM